MGNSDCSQITRWMVSDNQKCTIVPAVFRRVSINNQPDMLYYPLYSFDKVYPPPPKKKKKKKKKKDFTLTEVMEEEKNKH